MRTQLRDSSGLTDTGSFESDYDWDHLIPMRKNLVKSAEINVDILIQAWLGL